MIFDSPINGAERLASCAYWQSNDWMGKILFLANMKQGRVFFTWISNIYQNICHEKNLHITKQESLHYYFNSFISEFGSELYNLAMIMSSASAWRLSHGHSVVHSIRSFPHLQKEWKWSMRWMRQRLIHETWHDKQVYFFLPICAYDYDCKR